MSLRLLLVFSLTEFLLSLTPGPAVLLVVSQGMRRGFRPSLKGAAGILTGNAIYFALSALGLSALLLASASLFQVIKWAGAAYLILTGLKMLFSRRQGEVVGETNVKADSVKLFSEGLLTQLSNPKAIVFFSALLPQFVSPAGQVAQQFLILGVVSITVELPVLVGYGWAADRGGRLVLRSRFSSLVDRVAGGFLIGAGASLAAIRKL